MSSPKTFGGVLPVFQTPFDDQDRVDAESLDREIEWIFDHGCDGVVLGMVSEMFTLTDEERSAVTSIVGSIAERRGRPLIVSVGAESTAVAVHRARCAADAGASGVMATPPLLTTHAEPLVESYFVALIEASPVPVVVQDASAYIGAALSVAMQARLFERFGPERVLFKPEAVPLAPTLTALLAATSPAIRVFEGMGGAALLENRHLGLWGTMPGAEVCWAVKAIWDALDRGHTAAAASIQAPLERMMAMQADLDSFVACEKVLLEAQGVITSRRVRHPSSFVMTAEVETVILDALEDLRAAVAQVSVSATPEGAL